MTRGHRRGRGAAPVGLVGLLLLVGALAFADPTAGAARADGDGVPRVTVTPNANVHDGDSVTINVSADAPTRVYTAVARLCRGGVDYQASAGSQPADDFRQGGANCPLIPVSSSGDVSITDEEVFDFATEAGGESFLMRIGSGSVQWNDFKTKLDASLTCDSDHPCSLVVELQYTPTGSGDPTWKPVVVPIAYASGDALAGCGGPALGVLAAGASDRMTDAWIDWTLAECKLPGRKGATSRTSFVGEGEGVSQFAQGSLDLAYTAGGYDARMQLSAPIDPSLPNGGRRDAIAVPIAVNAAVVGVGGGYFTPSGKRKPFSDVRMPIDLLAKMFAGGPNNVAASDIGALNEGLGRAGPFNTSGAFQVAASPEAEAYSWYLTRVFDTLAPDAWQVPDVAAAGDDRLKSRGVDASLALADPGYNGFVDLLLGRPTIRKALFNLSLGQGGAWLLTDLASARSFGMEPAELPNAAGTFVPATPETLAAAVAGMQEDAQGIKISDPTVTTPVNGVTPYPATMVEYALVPAEPLINDDCSARTTSQGLLDSWLAYITSADGQAALPAGFVPLTPDLQAEAVARIALVGKSAVTGSCAGQTAVPAAVQTDAVAAPSGSDGGFASGTPSRTTPRSSSNPSPVTPATTPATDVDASSSSDRVELAAAPSYRGPGDPGSLGSVLALIGIVLLGSAAAFITAKSR